MYKEYEPPREGDSGRRGRVDIPAARRQPKVPKFDLAVTERKHVRLVNHLSPLAPHDENITGFDVHVRDSVRVQMLKPLKNLQRNGPQHLVWQGVPQRQILQRAGTRFQLDEQLLRVIHVRRWLRP